MNLLCKIGLSVLAGAAVLFGINCVEKKNASNSVKDSTSSSDNNILEDEDISITSSPDEMQKEKKTGFMESAKKTQMTIDIISKVITCLYRVIECINDIFFSNRFNRYSTFHQSTIII